MYVNQYRGKYLHPPVHTRYAHRYVSSTYVRPNVELTKVTTFSLCSAFATYGLVVDIVSRRGWSVGRSCSIHVPLVMLVGIVDHPPVSGFRVKCPSCRVWCHSPLAGTPQGASFSCPIARLRETVRLCTPRLRAPQRSRPAQQGGKNHL